MTRIQQQKTFAMLALIFLSSFILFSSCGKLPLVTLHQLDTIHGVANPFKITKYDDVKCELEIEPQPPININDGALMGGVCLTKEDYSKLKAKVKADCENNKPKN